MNMISINSLSFKINLKENKDTINIYEDENLKVLYPIDKFIFDSRITKKRGLTTKVNLLYYSKKESIGLFILLSYGQSIMKIKNQTYNITINVDKNKFIPYMLLLDKNMETKFLVKYNRIKDFHSENYTNSYSIQDSTNFCKYGEFQINQNIIYEDIELVIKKRIAINNNEKKLDCEPLFTYEVFPLLNFKNQHQ
ncbi:hypothetical protein ACM39_11605 [Chryseobacterium sp. FH2]|nr:hypothetical protein ACM39_11605 [Chryseobacterium sp. FH2]